MYSSIECMRLWDTSSRITSSFNGVVCSRVQIRVKSSHTTVGTANETTEELPQHNSQTTFFIDWERYDVRFPKWVGDADLTFCGTAWSRSSWSCSERSSCRGATRCSAANIAARPGGLNLFLWKPTLCLASHRQFMVFMNVSSMECL